MAHHQRDENGSDGAEVAADAGAEEFVDQQASPKADHEDKGRVDKIGQREVEGYLHQSQHHHDVAEVYPERVVADLPQQATLHIPSALDDLIDDQQAQDVGHLRRQLIGGAALDLAIQVPPVAFGDLHENRQDEKHCQGAQRETLDHNAVAQNEAQVIVCDHSQARIHPCQPDDGGIIHHMEDLEIGEDDGRNGPNQPDDEVIP